MCGAACPLLTPGPRPAPQLPPGGLCTQRVQELWILRGALRSTEGVNRTRTRGQGFGFCGCFAFPQGNGAVFTGLPPENTRSNPVCRRGPVTLSKGGSGPQKPSAFRWSGGAMSEEATKWEGALLTGRIRQRPLQTTEAVTPHRGKTMQHARLRRGDCSGSSRNRHSTRCKHAFLSNRSQPPHLPVTTHPSRLFCPLCNQLPSPGHVL